MKEVSRTIIGRNVKAIRLSLGLSLLKFSLATGISKASLVNVESGKNGYNLNLLDNILKFTNFTLTKLANETFKPNKNLREELLEKHKFNKDVQSYFFDQAPEIVYAIKHKLLSSDFFQSPREIREVRAYFESLGWHYKGTSISNALKRLNTQVLITAHPVKKNTFLYKSKQIM